MSANIATPELLLAKIDKLTETVLMLCRMQGKTLTRQEMLKRYGVCNSTLNKRIAAKQLPTPGTDGRWLVAEVFEYEARR